ncbi:8708_t:CDS:2 [Entrophospora sp. SA101]|nr:8708_t:CDS:2 [Entrophospora sp. SA101]
MNSSEDDVSTSTFITRKSSSGRPEMQVWNHFNKTVSSSRGHYAATCNYCEKIWARGKPDELQNHLATLCESMEKLQIKGGGIKTFTKTRWSTVFDICETILRLRSAFEDIIREKPENLSSLCIRTINSHGFFDDIRQLTIVLQPIKNAIGILESKNATLADCFFNLCCLASAIYYIPAITNNTYQNFCNYCIDKFNERWVQFEHKLFLLAYFLHPKYHGR